MKRLIVIVAAILSVSIAGDARADKAPAQCTFLEIEASNSGKKVDPALSALRGKLSRPPLSSWTNFKLLKQHNHQVQQGQEVQVSLVPGSKLSLFLRTATQEPGKKRRLRLELTLNDKNGKRKAKVTINLDSGDYTVVRGEPLAKGAQHILAVSCR